MSNKAPTFFRVATRPKWIGALFLALAVAAIFAALGQWQLDRTFTKDDPKTNTENSSLALVEKKLMLDTQHVYIVDGRLQNGITGHWLLANAKDENLVSTTLALGWAEKLETVESLRNQLMQSVQAQAFLPVVGYPLPPEGPQPADASLPSVTGWDTRKALNYVPKLFEELRKTYGFDHHLLHDGHHRYTPQESANLGKMLEPYQLFWLEDCTPAENQEAFKLVRQHTVTPLAVGEIFNTIGYGKNLMQGYAANLDVGDRWAIVAYLRAVKPVSNKVEPSVYRIPLPATYGPTVAGVTAPSVSTSWGSVSMLSFTGALAPPGPSSQTSTSKR